MSDVSLARSSSIPLHARISQLLVDLIESGELADGEQLPPERHLVELFGVSLAPVRQAILDTVSKGLLVRSRGQGTFVRAPGFEEKISILHSLTESIREQQVEVATRVLRQERVPTPPAIARALKMRTGESTFLERLAKSARRSFFTHVVWAAGLDIDHLYEQNDAQHRAIREAIAARSAQGARVLAREHVLASGRLQRELRDVLGLRGEHPPRRLLLRKPSRKAVVHGFREGREDRLLLQGEADQGDKVRHLAPPGEAA